MSSSFTVHGSALFIFSRRSRFGLRRLDCALEQRKAPSIIPLTRGEQVRIQ